MCIHSSERTRAYVKIEDGCDNRCAYCIVPQARGHVRSKPAEEVVEEVKGLVAAGYYEIVLTGIETACWGRDLGDENLADLLEKVDAIEGIGRIRLGSLDPSLMKPEFVDRIAKLSHLAPNFHLSMQSGSSRVLAAMRRRYNAETAESNIAYIRGKIPGVTFTADIIVGFPGETEEMFMETVDFVKRVGFIHLHIFPYSKRPGTEAAEMEDQIPEETKNERLKRLEDAEREAALKIAENYVGSQKDVLFELCEDGRAVGHTAEFLEVTVITPDDLHGQIKTVKLNGFDGSTYSGFIV